MNFNSIETLLSKHVVLKHVFDKSVKSGVVNVVCLHVSEKQLFRSLFNKHLVSLQRRTVNTNNECSDILVKLHSSESRHAIGQIL